MIRTCLVYGFALLLTVAAAHGQSESAYRANIGKTAFNTTNGVEIGRIVDVGQMNGVWVYKVNREGRIISSPVDNVVAKAVASTMAATPAPIAAGVKIDPKLEKTAGEFRGRLARNGASLQRLDLVDAVLTAGWSSSKCDAFEGEVIDLLLSVNRTVVSSPAINALRSCGGKSQTFSASAATFQQYRTGKINDVQVLKGIR